MWGRFDDNFPHHPKARRAGPEACWLFVCGVLHCNRFTTNGFIDALDLDILYPCPEWARGHVEELAERLVKAGLWELVKGGWQIHDYADYQREAMKDARDERRKWEAERKAKQRAAKRPGNPPTEKQAPPEECPGGTGVGQYRGTGVGHVDGTPVGQGLGQAQETSVSLSHPSRPDPSRPVPEIETDKVESAPETADGSAADAAREEASTAAKVREVFGHWQKVFEHPRARLDGKREALIRRRLREYDAATLCRVIDGYARDPFTLGENDRATKYDDIELLLRDAKHVEKGLGFLEHGAAVSAAADPWEEGLARYEAQLAAKRAALSAQGVNHG